MIHNATLSTAQLAHGLLCNGCACSAVNRLEKETGKRTFPQRRFRSPMKGFDSYDFWPYNVPRLIHEKGCVLAIPLT
jgi:hypothetical protein